MPITVKKREVFFYKNNRGVEPVRAYLNKLKDRAGRAKIQQKIVKASLGNFGQEGKGYRHIERDVWELKVDFGPGYRVYFKIEEDQIILLLMAGTKKTQQDDITKALKYSGD